jgi:transposase
MSASQVARDLDISVDTLHRWLHAARPATAPPSAAPTTTAELTRLRREVEQLRMEREILKKALGIFSRMPQ